MNKCWVKEQSALLTLHCDYLLPYINISLTLDYELVEGMGSIFL